MKSWRTALMGMILVGGLAQAAAPQGDEHGNPSGPTVLRCVGDEPFWNIDIAKDKLKGAGGFETPNGIDDSKIKLGKVRVASNRVPDFVRVYPLDFVTSGQRGELVVRQGNCTGPGEGAEAQFGYSGILIRGDEVLEGCCRLTK
ncbi:MAG: hypothetical protein JST16_10260 [Bdellovibrionales bacterium]|nr:hypothetical protein [Bdellovibrionales bacterium]